MIKRINFIGEQAFAITYMMLAMALAVIFVLNMGLGYMEGRALKNAEETLVEKNALVETLLEEKQQLDKKPVIKKKKENIGVGAYQDLFELLSAYPKWAGVIDDITKNLPNAVWITGVTSAVTQKSAAPEIQPEGADEASQEPAKPSNLLGPETIKLTLTGLAVDVDGLSLFVKNMQNSEHFTRTTIQESQKESFGFQFTLESFLNLDYVE